MVMLCRRKVVKTSLSVVSPSCLLKSRNCTTIANATNINNKQNTQNNLNNNNNNNTNNTNKNNNGPTAILMMNMGGPSTISEVQPFLTRLFTDSTIISLPFQKFLGPAIAKLRSPGVSKLYASIGGGSPIFSWSTKQGKGMTELMDKLYPESAPHKHYVAFRYAPPLTEEAIESMAKDGVKRVVAFSQYPQYSCATTGSSLTHLWTNLHKMGLENTFQWSVIDRWHSHPAYIKAVAHKIQEGLNKYFTPSDYDNLTIVFSAHSLPMKRVQKGDPYPHEIAASVQAVMTHLNHQHQYIISFQSRVGPVEWLGPSTVDTVTSLSRSSKKNVLVVPIAFTSDHVETLSEIDIELAHTAKELGLKLHRAPSLNDDPEFIKALATIVGEHLQNKQVMTPQYPMKCVGCPNIHLSSSSSSPENVSFSIPCRHIVNPIKY